LRGSSPKTKIAIEPISPPAGQIPQINRGHVTWAVRATALSANGVRLIRVSDTFFFFRAVLSRQRQGTVGKSPTRSATVYRSLDNSPPGVVGLTFFCERVDRGFGSRNPRVYLLRLQAFRSTPPGPPFWRVDTQISRAWSLSKQSQHMLQAKPLTVDRSAAGGRRHSGFVLEFKPV